MSAPCRPSAAIALTHGCTKAWPAFSLAAGSGWSRAPTSPLASAHKHTTDKPLICIARRDVGGGFGACTFGDMIPKRGGEVEAALFYELEQLLLVPVAAAERREPTEQNVENNPQRPHVHRNTVSC